MNAARRNALVAAFAVLAPLTCRGQGRPAGKETATSPAEFQCGASRLRTTNAVTTIGREQACAIVNTAMRALATTRRQEGLPDPADTALVKAARVHDLREVTLTGDTVAVWWSVTLRLPAKNYDVEVRINKAGGEPVVAKTHKPFIEPGS